MPSPRLPAAHLCAMVAYLERAQGSARRLPNSASSMVRDLESVNLLNVYPAPEPFGDTEVRECLEWYRAHPVSDEQAARLVLSFRYYTLDIASGRLETHPSHPWHDIAARGFPKVEKALSDIEQCAAFGASTRTAWILRGPPRDGARASE